MISKIALAVLTVLTLPLCAQAAQLEDCQNAFPREKLTLTRDDINLPFENDPNVLGQWESVDFVKSPEQFTPSAPRYAPEDLFLKELIFLPEGRMAGSPQTWTKGFVLHEGDQTASAYKINEIEGQKYMFFEWKSGDYTCLGRKPYYYVLKKSADLRTDDVNLPFKNDKKVLGKWRAVDFVFQPEDFSPEQKYWRGDLYLKTLTFLPKGKTPMSPAITWTKGFVLHRGDKTSSAYEIKKINGKEYLFFEWKSGDYLFRGKKPACYVLERAR